MLLAKSDTEKHAESPFAIFLPVRKKEAETQRPIFRYVYMYLHSKMATSNFWYTLMINSIYIQFCFYSVRFYFIADD